MKMISNLFKKEEPQPDNKRMVRELLRENLNLITVDMFYMDDPMVGLKERDRKSYLKYFFDLYKDDKLIKRLKFHINRQAQKTLGNAKDGVEDLAGAMNVNGLAFVLNDIERLANMYIKEEESKKEKKIDKFAIIPEVG